VLRAAGIATPDPWTVRSFYSIAQSKSACLDLLGQHPELTAVICGNDVIAQGALAATMQMGLRVPQDISIIGIGDFVGSADIFPALTTVRIPAQEIGARAGQDLVEAVAASENGQIASRRFPVSVIARATTAALKC
jgi:LacI family transcriptional regulator